MIYICVLFLCLCSCTDEDFVKQGFVGEGETSVLLNFGQTQYEDVKVTMRSTLTEVPESRVYNMFVYVFVNGSRVYSHYFDSTNRLETKTQVQEANTNCWMVDNQDAQGGEATNGTLRICVPMITNGTIYMVANIDADMVNISPEKLNIIRTEAELLELTASLNQEITSRNGYFPMSGKLEGIDIDENGIRPPGGGSATVELERLDAKVIVKVRVATGNEIETTENGITTKQTMKEFVPESWQVLNLPKGSTVMPSISDNNGAGYFDSEVFSFETETIESFTYSDSKGSSQSVESKVSGFSFYMLENREPMKKSVNGNYHLRDKRIKDVAGAYDTTNGMWEYAPEDATYIIIKGDVLMNVDVSEQAREQQLTASVVYYIHLGDFASEMDNYDIDRNTRYTYTITIKGVNSIDIEVKTSADGDANKVIENEAGATGHVYISKEMQFTFDAHYGQRVFCLDQEDIEPDRVTWYVKTPFGKEGTPPKIGGVEVPSGFDYKWVQFMVNNVDMTTGSYSHNNNLYPGDGHTSLMNVLEFTKYIKQQKIAFDNGEPNDFLAEEDANLKANYPDNPEKYRRYKIYVTVFVDEYYYEKDPISGDTSGDLWKKFVNQPNRLMHILCDSDTSLDGESSATGSVITLRQRSIQTPYTLLNGDLNTAWGIETVDETVDSYFWFYDPNETRTNAPTVPSLENDSRNNGLYNTACLWGVVSRGSYVNGVRWDKFLDFERPNDYVSEAGYPLIWMKEDYAVMRYASLMRNRDNNGNGVIDPEEVRWYTASLEQLYGLYMGELGINEQARMLRPEVKQRTGTWGANHPLSGAPQWREHIVSSTRRSSSIPQPTVIWAEEGISISHYREEFGWNAINWGTFSIRCMRNLGLSNATSANIANKEANLPEDLIKVKRPTGTITENSVYEFDLSNINTHSLRYKTTHELEPSDENSEQARLYSRFETGPIVTTGNYATLKATLESGLSPITDVNYSDYHVPNVREVALMYLYCTDSEAWWNGMIQPGTWSSLSQYGNNIYNAEGGEGTWVFSRGSTDLVTMGNKSTQTRIVRDL